MKPVTTLILSILLAGIAGYTSAKLAIPQAQYVAEKESTFDRVMRTKELRCGYNVWPPAVLIDPNTGKVGGFIPDMVEYAANSVGIKVKWVTQAGWSSFPEDIKNKRFDAMCAGAWAVKENAPNLAFTRPILFNPVYPYVRTDDARFDNDLSILNDPQYKIGAIDGAMGSTIAKNDFPKARIVGLPQLSDPSQVLTDLIFGKSDLAFMEGSFAQEFQNKNPGKIRIVGTEPYRSFPSPLLAVSIDEPKLALMFDTIIGEMQLQGTVERILKKYNADPVMFVRPAKPYATGE